MPRDSTGKLFRPEAQERRSAKGRGKPRLRASAVADWARAHRRRTGAWPTPQSGPIPESPGDTWGTIHSAFLLGMRGLPGGISLPEFLAGYQHNPLGRAPRAEVRLDVPRICAWAEAFRKRTGRLPHQHAGLIEGTNGLTWMVVDEALRNGHHGLPGGSSLAKLLNKKPGSARNVHSVPLTTEQILKWADAFRERTGRWPTARSGSIAEAPGETWQAVQSALHGGYRGFKGGMTLGRFLVKRRGAQLPLKHHDPLTAEQILAWADSHHARTGRWPFRTSGDIPEAQGETWESVATALVTGGRGLPRSSLSKLLAEKRGVRNPSGLAPLTPQQILKWADEHHRRTGKWPTTQGGAIPDSGGETWARVAYAMYAGRRGLGSGMSLAKLLQQERARRPDGRDPDNR